jgi:hypothetical protein
MSQLGQQSDRFRRAADVEAETPITAGSPKANLYNWSEEQQQQLFRWVQKFILGRSCPMCGQQTLSPYQSFVQIRSLMGPGQCVADEKYLRVECRTCGHTLFFSAHTAGVDTGERSA